MSLRRLQRRAIVCKYLTFFDPNLKSSFRLPLVHIRIKHGDATIRTDALVDSGATGTFLPLELSEILNITLTPNTVNAMGAGGLFPTHHVRIDSIEILKGRTCFCEFRNLMVRIPARRGAIPHVVLGRDSIFRRYDITYREDEENMIFRHPRQSSQR